MGVQEEASGRSKGAESKPTSLGVRRGQDLVQRRLHGVGRRVCVGGGLPAGSAGLRLSGALPPQRGVVLGVPRDEVVEQQAPLGVRQLDPPLRQRGWLWHRRRGGDLERGGGGGGGTGLLAVEAGHEGEGLQLGGQGALVRGGGR